jgi:hypothetical protein
MAQFMILAVEAASERLSTNRASMVSFPALCRGRIERLS